MQLPRKLQSEKTLRLLERLVEEQSQKINASPDIDSIINVWRVHRSLTNRQQKLLLIAGMGALHNDTSLNGLWDYLISELRKTEKRTLLKAGLSAFYQTYGQPYSNVLKGILLDKLDLFSFSLQQGLKKNKILHNAGPASLAQNISITEQPFELLKSVGLSSLEMGSAFLIHTYSELAKNFKVFGYTEQELMNFKSLLIDSANGPERFKLDGYENVYAEAMLGYYLAHLPTKSRKEYLKNLFISNLRDPRLYPQRWGYVDAVYKKLMQRWLTEESFEMLLQVLDAIADPGHWNDRKGFWTYYLENDFISDSWVIFGNEAYQQARYLQRQGMLAKSAGYAKFNKRSGPIQANHSVLLMRVGNLIISEWTHSGRVRIFLNKSKRAPDFYKAEYSVAQIQFNGVRLTSENVDSSFDVYMDHHVNWQPKVAEFIRLHTGIKHECLLKGY